MIEGHACPACAPRDPHPADLHHSLSAGMGSVRKLLDVLRAEMAEAQVPPGLNDTAQIILAEVFNNIVEHAYRFAHGQPMEVSIWVRPDGIECVVCDEGSPMPWGRAPAGMMPEIDVDRPGSWPEGGFGWALVRDLTEDIQYCRTADRNRLRFVIPAIAGDGTA